jgi:DNA-binding XRE family transcriptional regulator
MPRPFEMFLDSDDAVQWTTDVERVALFQSTITEFRVRADTAVFASDAGAGEGIEGGIHARDEPSRGWVVPRDALGGCHERGRECRLLVVGAVRAGGSSQRKQDMGRARSTTAANRFIGMRIRERRMTNGLSQRQLGELIGVTPKQLNKYEHGINGVSAGRLYEIARELSTPLEYFFEDPEQAESQLLPRQRKLLDLMPHSSGTLK